MSEHVVRPHPQGVRPSGNAVSVRSNAVSSMGFLAVLGDEILLSILSWLSIDDLRKLGSTCRALFAFTCHDELWKPLRLQQESSDPESCGSWHGSWRATCLGHRPSKVASIDTLVCSDALYRPYFCSQIDLTPFISNTPLRNWISRLDNLSAADFASEWSDRPFMLTEAIKCWPVLKNWCSETLLQRYGQVKFRAEAAEWPLADYVEYMNDNEDESPLYLFDKDFVQKMELSTEETHGAFWSPPCFAEDLFEVLGEQRPDHRWLIIGGRRSGSTFHKDPNSTSAWNAVIKGSKYWIMFPPSQLPPGVIVSQDQSEITSPYSIAEWLLNFHQEARHMQSCREVICNAGEVVHVPSGWWHLVVNLEPTIAITQNFVPKAHLGNVLDFLRNKPQQVSGFGDNIQDPCQLFLNKLRINDIDTSGYLNNTKNKKRAFKDFLRDGRPENVETAQPFQFCFTDVAGEAC